MLLLETWLHFILSSLIYLNFFIWLKKIKKNIVDLILVL